MSLRTSAQHAARIGPLLLAVASIGCAIIAGLEDGELADGEGGAGPGPGPGPGSTTSFPSSTDTAGGGFPGGAYVSEVLLDEPIHYWRLGEPAASFVVDLGDGLSDGSYLGGVTLGVEGAIAGDPDTAAWFDGIGGQVSVDGVFPFVGTDAFSVELWAKPESIGGALVAQADYDPVMGYSGWILVQDPDTGGGLQLVRTDGASGFDVVESEALPPDVFTHVVGTFDGVTMTFYVNGAAVSSTFAGFDAGFAGAPLTMAFLPSWDPYAGVLDEVALYDYALPPDRVTAHYQAGITP